MQIAESSLLNAPNLFEDKRLEVRSLANSSQHHFASYTYVCQMHTMVFGTQLDTLLKPSQDYVTGLTGKKLLEILRARRTFGYS